MNDFERIFTQEQVDAWVEEEGEFDSYRLLDKCLPKMRAKLNRLDKRIIDVLEEVREVFPDAEYYTASGGFTLVLGETHDDSRYASPQNQRSAWGGSASIGDGDW